MNTRAPITKARSTWEEQDGWWLRRVADGQLRAIVVEEPLGWHLSISFIDHRGRPARYPRWDEIADARDLLLPADVGFVMHLPPADEYVA
ncbi:MAG: hypothetical protein AB7O29_12795, partial [Acidimicrobiia bacterium]